jgi:hypothetical protein
MIINFFNINVFAKKEERKVKISKLKKEKRKKRFQINNYETQN